MTNNQLKNCREVIVNRTNNTRTSNMRADNNMLPSGSFLRQPYDDSIDDYSMNSDNSK